jgi:hypothetical protein
MPESWKKLFGASALKRDVHEILIATNSPGFR